jgi:pimeloyl-ACP methyl ester carboxylesterase
LILVHGFGGHAHWWSFLAPFFTDRYRVVALDLPGMGQSGHLEVYDDDCFAAAILGLVRHHQWRDVTVVGHSFGGVQTLRAMAREAALFKRGIVVDSFIPLPPRPPPRVFEPRGTHNLQPSRAACMARFRVMPPQPDLIDALLGFVCWHSCTANAQGWHWKFDPGLSNAGELKSPEILSAIASRVDFIYGERSMFNVDDLPRRVLEQCPNHGELLIVPNAYHHIMLDHPLELVAAINRLL